LAALYVAATGSFSATLNLLERRLDIPRRSALCNPYQAWIDTYVDEHFGLAVQRVIAIADRAAAAALPSVHERMLRAVERSNNTNGYLGTAPYERCAWPPVHEDEVD
jgi:thiaminase (transcriptional activator TenA)